MEASLFGLKKDSILGKPDIKSRAQKAQLRASAELVANLREMVNEPSFSDMKFVCSDGKLVQACRMLLASRSAVLKSMFTNGMAESSQSEIQLPEVSSSVLLSVLEFLYTGTLVDYCPQNWRMACEVIIASRFFLLPDLEVITRKLMDTQISIIVQDLPKVASMLTEALEFKALQDETDITLRELVTILSSDWSKLDYVQSLSEDAFHYLLVTSKRNFEDDEGCFHYLLATSKRNCEDDQSMLFKEYLRFRQVVLWSVCHHKNQGAQELLNALVPDEGTALSLCRGRFNLLRIDDSISQSSDWESMQLDEATRHATIRLLSNIDYRRIHPVLLAEVVKPLELISSSELLDAFQFHALRGPMTFKTVTIDWEHGESYRTSEDGFVIQKSKRNIGVAVMHAAMFRLCCVYEWCFIMEEVPLGFCELGLVSWKYISRTQKHSSHRFDGKRLIGQSDCKVWDFLGFARINSEAARRFVFQFNPSKRTCSLFLNGKDFGVVWKDLCETYYPAVSLGDGGQGRVRVELVTGFDLL